MTEFAKEYGEGLFLLAQEERCTDQILDELFSLKSILHENPDYCRLLSNLSVPAEERLHILHETFDQRIHPYLVNFLCLLLKRGMLAEFDLCCEKYRQLFYAERKITDAVVTTPMALDESKLAELRAKLERKTGGTVLLKQTIDPSLMGGLRVEMGGQTYDNSVQFRLADLRRILKEE